MNRYSRLVSIMKAGLAPLFRARPALLSASYVRTREQLMMRTAAAGPRLSVVPLPSAIGGEYRLESTASDVYALPSCILVAH